MQGEVAGKLDDLMALIEVESELAGVEIPAESGKSTSDSLL